MHGVHFQKKGDTLLIWMDMLENNKHLRRGIQIPLYGTAGLAVDYQSSNIYTIDK